MMPHEREESQLHAFSPALNKLLSSCPSLLSAYKSYPFCTAPFYLLDTVLLLNPCVRAKSFQSRLTLCNPMDSSPSGSSVYGTVQAKYRSGLPFPTPGDLPNPGIEPVSLMSPALAGRFLNTSNTWDRANRIFKIY